MDTQLDHHHYIIEKGIVHVVLESKGHGLGKFFVNLSENRPGSAPDLLITPKCRFSFGDNAFSIKFPANFVGPPQRC